MTTGAARRIRAHRRLALIAIATIAVSILLVSYESWRASVASQIVRRVDFLNSSDTCGWTFVPAIVDEFRGKADFIEGGAIHATVLGATGRQS